MTGVYQQIPLRQVSAHKAKGWTVAEDLSQPSHHNAWSVLMLAPTRWQRLVAALRAAINQVKHRSPIE